MGNFSNNKIRPEIVHRLDKNTTGLLVVAKALKTLTLLKKQIEEKTMLRKYIFYATIISQQKKIVEQAIDQDRKNKTVKMVISFSKKAKKVITEINLSENLKNNLALVECTLYTGRTHQIHVHLKFINHCAYNDNLYCKNEDKEKYGQFSHSYEISFIQPWTKKILSEQYPW